MTERAFLRFLLVFVGAMLLWCAWPVVYHGLVHEWCERAGGGVNHDSHMCEFEEPTMGYALP